MLALPKPMPEGCPWSGYRQPNIDWCEAELCSWITNPADTWSNLAYIVLGLLMWHGARRRGSKTLAMFGPASIIVGAFSFAYHASYTAFFQFFDFVGMFVFALLVVTLNLRRAGILSPKKQLLFYIATVTAYSALVPPLQYVGFPIQSMVGVLILIILVQEARLYRTTARHKAFFISLALLGAGAVCSALDLSRVWCNPNDHFIQGHAIWHILTSLSLYVLYHFFTQFDLDSPQVGPAGEAASA